MDTIEAIYARRSIKAFDPNHKITEEEKTKLLEAAIQSPTSFNIQHWRFVVIIDDPQLRTQIRAHGMDQAQMTDASLLILMTADVQAWQKSARALLGRNAPKEVAELLVGWMGPFHEGRDELQRDEAQRSIGMAMHDPHARGEIHGLRLLPDDRLRPRQGRPSSSTSPRTTPSGPWSPSARAPRTPGPSRDSSRWMRLLCTIGLAIDQY